MSVKSSNASKTRIGLLLKEKAGKKSKNRSGELVAMTERFEVLKGKMKSLVASLHAQHAAMAELNNTRQEVAKQVGSLAERSPIFEYAGQLPGSETPKGAITSYASVHQSMGNRNKMYIDRYKQFVVDYGVEWEKVVVTRISNDLKTSEKFRLDLDHYQTKVEAIRKDVNNIMAKGKLVDPKKSEKLKRNEEKLNKARAEYEDFASNLCILIEEVTERAWKDLHPLLIKMAQFDATLSSDEAKLFGELNSVTNNLKNIAQQHGLKPQARLKELSVQSASQIDTSGTDGTLRIENGLEGLSSPIADAPERTGGGGVLSPGSVHSFDSGVSPTNTNVSEPDPFSRATSFSSAGSYGQYSASGPGPNTNSMMAVAAASAPPPTLDMLSTSAGSMTIGGGAPSPHHFNSSGSLPPLPRSNSHVSEAMLVAPPPMAAPPPPPPAVGMSMYSGPVDVDSVPSTDLATAAPSAPGYGNYNMSAAPASAPLPPLAAYNAPPQAPTPGYGSPMGGAPMGGSSNPFDN